MRDRTKAVIVALQICAWAGWAFPQQPSTRAMSPAEVLKQAQKTSSELEQLRAALRSPDSSTRVSTMVAMVESNNPSLTSLAISEGNASSDEAMRTLAVRAAFREVQALTPQPVNQLTGNTADAFANLSRDGSGLQLAIKSYDWNSGKFTAGFHGIGQVSGSRLELQMPMCSGTLKPTEGSWIFEGRVTCLKGSIKLSELMRVQIR